jgi:hypothetical protein
MKKSYIAPQTEAIEVIANGVLMVSPGGFIDPLGGFGSGSGGGGMM